MQFTLPDLRSDDRAVSPVIGVILMVAITVILAAVIGSFVLGIGGQQEAAPQASITITENTDGDVNINHRGGDSFTNSSTANLTITNGTATATATDNLTFSAGDTINTTGITNSEDNTGIEASGHVDVVWEGPQGTEQIIASRTF